MAGWIWVVLSRLLLYIGNARQLLRFWWACKQVFLDCSCVPCREMCAVLSWGASTNVLSIQSGWHGLEIAVVDVPIITLLQLGYRSSYHHPIVQVVTLSDHLTAGRGPAWQPTASQKRQLMPWQRYGRKLSYKLIVMVKCGIMPHKTNPEATIQANCWDENMERMNISLRIGLQELSSIGGWG